MTEANVCGYESEELRASFVEWVQRAVSNHHRLAVAPGSLLSFVWRSGK
jgi:hypothetical protein